MAESTASLPEIDISILVADLVRGAGAPGFVDAATTRIRELLVQHGNQQFNAGRAFEHERLAGERAASTTTRS